MTTSMYTICFCNELMQSVPDACHAYDWRLNPRPELRELAVFYDMYQRRIYDRHCYVGAVSPKFQEKCKVAHGAFLEWVEQNPGYDLYVINPRPQYIYSFFNVWEQGEFLYQGFMEAASKVFRLLGLAGDIASAGRHSHGLFSVSNYWVANGRFWSRYGEILSAALSLGRNDLGGRLYDFLHRNRPRYSRQLPFVPVFTIILERLVNHLAEFDTALRPLFFPASRQRILRCMRTPFDRLVYAVFGDFVDGMDSEGSYGPADRVYFARTGQATRPFQPVILRYPSPA